jgi:hypothetical protein
MKGHEYSTLNWKSDTCTMLTGSIPLLRCEYTISYSKYTLQTDKWTSRKLTSDLHSTNRWMDKQEVNIGFVRKQIPPYGMPKQSVQNFQASVISSCWEKRNKNFLLIDIKGQNSTLPLLQSRSMINTLFKRKQRLPLPQEIFPFNGYTEVFI